MGINEFSSTALVAVVVCTPVYTSELNAVMPKSDSARMAATLPQQRAFAPGVAQRKWRQQGKGNQPAHERKRHRRHGGVHGAGQDKITRPKQRGEHQQHIGQAMGGAEVVISLECQGLPNSANAGLVVWPICAAHKTQRSGPGWEHDRRQDREYGR